MPSVIGTPVVQYQGDVTSNTLSVTVPSADRRFLLIHVGAFDGGGGSISSVTVDGNAATQIGTSVGDITSEGLAEQWGYVAPDVGTYNVVVTADSSLTELILGVSAWEDVNQTTPTQNATGSTGGGNNPSQTVTTGGGSNVPVAFIEFYSGITTSAVPSDTQLFNLAPGEDTTGANAQYGDGTFSWTIGSNPDWSIVGCDLIHDAGAAGSPGLQIRFLPLLGVG